MNSPKIIFVVCDGCEECKKRGIPTKRILRSLIVGSVQNRRPGAESTYSVVSAALPDNKLPPEWVQDATKVRNATDDDWSGICNLAEFDSELKKIIKRIEASK